MYSPHCGVLNDDNNFRCASCSKVIQPVTTTDLSDSRAMRILLPVGRSWWAIAAGYAGLFALLLVPAPLALLLGAIAVRHLKRNPGLHGMGRAVFAIIAGTGGTAVLAWLLLAGS